MRWIVLILLIVQLTSCRTEQGRDFEVIAYRGFLESVNDTVIYHYRFDLYAKIDKEGNCVITKYDHSNTNQFKDIEIKHAKIEKEDNYALLRHHYSTINNFKSKQIDKHKFLNVFNFINEVKSDTLLFNDEPALYDGPVIHIKVHNKAEKSINIDLNCLSRSNYDIVRLYKYLKSISDKLPVDRDIDSIGIIKSKDILMNEIIKKEMSLIKPFSIRQDIEFVPPIITVEDTVCEP